jgi:fatty acid synthase subunit alpha
MQQTFNGQLGKQSTSLIARMVSSKMPGGFNITAVRKHLETRWVWPLVDRMASFFLP